MGIGIAQDNNTTEPIFTFESVMQLPDSHIDFADTEWQSNSQTFDFSYVSAGKSLIFHYDISNNKLSTTGDDDPCAFQFSEEQIVTFGAADCKRSLSPNNRYVVYQIEDMACREDCSNTLAVGDLETGAHTIIRKNPDAGFIVRWSESSNAFLILDNGQNSNLGKIWHIALPQNIAAAAEITATLLASFPVGEIGFVDISPDGQQVLIHGIGYFGIGLTVWNTSLPSDAQEFAAWTQGHSFLAHHRIGGASFIPNERTHILVVTDEGIIKYNLDTDTFTVINSQINRITSDWVYFSSDTHYVLVYYLIPDEIARQKLTLFQLN